MDNKNHTKCTCWKCIEKIQRNREYMKIYMQTYRRDPNEPKKKKEKKPKYKSYRSYNKPLEPSNDFFLTRDRGDYLVEFN